MKVNELKDRSPVDEIILEITEKEEPREVRNGQLRVCNCKGKDDTGEVTITLWNDDIEKVNEGDKIKITKGWSSIYNSNMQVSTGKMGSLEVLK